MISTSRIYIAGHNGMVGSAIYRLLKKQGYTNLITISSKQLDLRNQREVEKFFRTEKPEYVFLAAAKVGGILANNNHRGQFIYENLMIQCNIIHSSYLNNVKKLMFLGSSCIYPKKSEIPIQESSLLSGPLEPTNRPYAIAKIAGIEMCRSYREQYKSNFIALMPTNLYGPNDNYHPEHSHVLPALIRKIYLAKKECRKEVIIWGSGKPRREFLHVDDLANACLFLMKNYNGSEIINVGSGKDISIMELAQLIKKIIGFQGNLIFDENYPDGTFRKLLDNSFINSLGWKATIKLQNGIKTTIDDFISNVESV